MIYVNRFWLSYIWSAVSGDLDDPKLMLKDMNEPENFNTLIQEYLLPSYENYKKYQDVSFNRMKSTWKYAINFYNEEELDRAFESGVPAFSIPSSPRDFYIKIWNTIFPSESWEICDKERYVDLENRLIDIYDYEKNDE